MYLIYKYQQLKVIMIKISCVKEHHAPRTVRVMAPPTSASVVKVSDLRAMGLRVEVYT